MKHAKVLIPLLTALLLTLFGATALAATCPYGHPATDIRYTANTANNTHDWSCVNCTSAGNEACIFVRVTNTGDPMTHSVMCGFCSNTRAEAHGFNRWIPTQNGSQHTRQCACGFTQTEAHDYGQRARYIDGSTHERLCIDCNKALVEGHDYGGWGITPGGTHHVRYCGTAGCESSNSHEIVWGDWESMGEYTHIRYCINGGCSVYDAHNENWGPYVLTSDGKHTAQCSLCDLTHAHAADLGAWTPDPANPLRHIRACRTTGCDYTETAAHEYVNGVCVCGAVKPTPPASPTKAPEEEKHTHWYGDWTPDADGKHASACRDEECGFERKIACATLALTLGEKEYALCPVCGDGGEVGAGVRLLNAAKEYYAEPTAFAFELDGAKIVTVALEMLGAPIADEGNYTFELPTDKLPEGWLNEDIAILDAEGAWQVLECELADGVLKFQIAQSAAVLKFGE